VRRTQFENARSFVQYFNLHGVSGVSATYRRLLRREVVDICMLIFIADVVTGVQIPLFPLYTISLGASLGLLGVIGQSLDSPASHPRFLSECCPTGSIARPFLSAG